MSQIEYCLHQNNIEPLIAKLKRLDPTRRWKVTALEWKSKRSLEQNALIWQFFTDFGSQCGYEGKQEIEELKKLVTLEVSPVVVTNKLSGKTHHVPPETSKLNTKEFSELMEKLIRYAAKEGFYWEAS